MATETVAIELQDNVSAPAQDAARALQQLQTRIVADTQALREMQAAMRALQGSASVDVNAFKQLRDMIIAKKASLSSANAEFIKLGGTFDKVRKPAEDLGPAVSDLAPSIEDAAKAVKRGGFGGFADQLFDMGEALSTMPGILIAVASAAVALSAAVIVGFAKAAVSLVEFGIGAAAAVRDTKLLLATAAKAPGEVAGMMTAIDNVAAVTPTARSELAKMAVELRKAGVAGAGLEAALLKKATKGSTLAVAAEQSRNLSVQSMRLKENLTGLFSGVKLDPLLNAFRDFVSLFGESTESGKALKTLVESIFNPLISALGLAGPGVNSFFKGMVIGALKVAIAAQLVKIRLREMLSGVDLSGISGSFRTLGEFAIYAAIGIGIFAAVVAAVIGWVLLTTAAIFGLVGVFFLVAFKVAEALMGIPAAIMSINNFIISRAAAMVDAGFQFAAGLADGIRSGLSEVISAAIGLASGAVDAVKNKLKIRSPSKVFAELGMQMTAGLAGGLDSGGDNVAAATANAVNVPSKTVGAGGGNRSIGNVTINIHAKDTDTGESIADVVIRRLGDLLNSGVESGISPEPEPA